MALTQITTNGIKDSTIVTADIADSAITGAKLAKPVDLSEDEKIRIGADNDLQIYHQTGTPGISHIKSHTIADLEIGKYGTTAGNVYVKFGSDDSAIFKKDGAVELYYDDAKKFETTSGGVNITGEVGLGGSAGTSGQVLKSGGSGAAATWGTAYTHPNHSGEVTSTADGAQEIADDVVDEANLKVSNAPTNGHVLTAQSGNTGGLTWAAPSGGAWQHVSGVEDPDSQNVYFTGLTKTNVCRYKLVFTGLRFGNTGESSADFRIRLGTTNGYYSTSNGYRTTGWYQNYQSTTQTGIEGTESGIEPTLGESGNVMNGHMYLSVPQTNYDSEEGNKAVWGYIQQNDGFITYHCRIEQSDLRANDIDRIQIYGWHSSHKIKYGRIDLYKLTF